jgi:hypothetical protein
VLDVHGKKRSVGSAYGEKAGRYISSTKNWAKGLKTGKAQGGKDYYVAGEGNISPSQFNNSYSGYTESQITKGNSSFLGYHYPNDMSNKGTRFVKLSNGKEVDMIHFMVVGRSGHLLGIANEIQQAFRLKSSAFNPQDLYSNILGVNFFDRYSPLIQQNPTRTSEYIYWYLSNPLNTK